MKTISTAEPFSKRLIKILAVDDNPADLFFLKRALSSLAAQLLFVSASDGMQAQEILQNSTEDSETEAPALMFSDINMPRQNGFELLKWMKTTPKMQSIPVVMISSFENKTAMDTAHQLGAAACLKKPINKMELSLVLDCLLKGFAQRNSLSSQPGSPLPHSPGEDGSRDHWVPEFPRQPHLFLDTSVIAAVAQ